MGDINHIINGLQIFRSKLKIAEDGDDGSTTCVDALDCEFISVRNTDVGDQGSPFNPDLFTAEELDKLDADGWVYDSFNKKWDYDLL